MADIEDIETGDRVRFNATGLPDEKIGTPAGEHSWQEYFGGETGIVQVVDKQNETVAIRSPSHSVHGHPFLVWIAPEHVTKIV
jgi:hypothetical protein